MLLHVTARFWDMSDIQKLIEYGKSSLSSYFLEPIIRNLIPYNDNFSRKFSID